jgi:hypothetical protein
MRPLHLLGMTLIAAIPLCAVFGVFGPSSETRSATTELMELTVEYPTRCRYEVVEMLDVQVTNRTGRVLEGVTVVFAPSYMDGFSQASFTPTPQRPFEVNLHPLQPGQTARVSGEIQGQRYGRYSGQVTARIGTGGPEAGPAAAVSIDVSTLIFP